MTRNSVADRWANVVSSDSSSYTSTIQTKEKITNLIGSKYIQTLIDSSSGGSLCLETGCGSGAFSLAFAATGRRVISMDISQSILKNILANKERLASAFPKITSLLALRGDIEKLPFADNTFQTVFSEGVIEHWTDRNERASVLSEMNRVIAPGGYLVVFVPNGRHPFHRWWKITGYPGYASEDKVPWHRFGSAELGKELEQSGFSDVQYDGVSPWSTLGIWPNWFIFRALAYICARIFPAPISLRRRWGFNLLAIGKKK